MPTEAQEGVRDLTRCCDDVRADIVRWRDNASINFQFRMKRGTPLDAGPSISALDEGRSKQPWRPSRRGHATIVTIQYGTSTRNAPLWPSMRKLPESISHP